MITFLKEFKIPTILGISIIFAGIIAGVLLVVKDKVFITKASPDLNPQNITISNITDESVTISWQTSAPTTGFIKYGKSSTDEQSALDDRDNKSPQDHSVHYITLKNLMPKTTYKYQIVSGKAIFETSEFITADPIQNQSGIQPIIGSVLADKTALSEGIVYLSIDGAKVQSTLIKNNGSFLIPLAATRDLSLSNLFTFTLETTAKISVTSPVGGATVLFKLNPQNQTLPTINIGDNLDLTNIKPKTPINEMNVFDLNEDGEVNSADNAVILNNLNKPVTDKKIDLNNDGVIDQKDLDLLSKNINQ